MITRRFLFCCLCMIFSEAGGKVCTKREEIGNREGNHYNCDDPVRTECCERNQTFTCCEEQWKNSAQQMLWLLLVVSVILISICLIVRYLTGQSEFFTSPTLKDAVINWKSTMCRRFYNLCTPGCRKQPRQGDNSFFNLTSDQNTLVSTNKMYLSTKA
nr:hypothetical protein BgiMline_007300 [Biomphalaria glabrata]